MIENLSLWNIPSIICNCNVQKINNKYFLYISDISNLAETS